MFYVYVTLANAEQSNSCSDCCHSTRREVEEVEKEWQLGVGGGVVRSGGGGDGQVEVGGREGSVVGTGAQEEKEEGGGTAETEYEYEEGTEEREEEEG